jgi:hypothetical protein
LIAAGVLVGSWTASAPTSASCTGQFFSSHAGSGAQGVTVGGLIAPTAQEFGVELGRRSLLHTGSTREHCGL